MRFSATFVALAAPLFVQAAPIRRASETDLLVMKFADVLEQLEAAFYQQALERFQASDFINAGYADSNVPAEQFITIQSDEAAHSTFLQSAIRAFGGEPITTCRFNFESALTDVATMAATARAVEAVGVSAYMGGASLLEDPHVLVAAASILTVEARHQSVLNILSGQGTAIPSAFDMALTPSEVLAIALPFIDNSSPCDVGVPANPTLSITNTGSVGPGTLLTFSSDAITGPTDGLFCQMLIGGAESSIPLPLDGCVVPDGINGPVAIWITSDSQPLLNNVKDRATTQLVAGPTMAFIDTQPQAIGQLIRGNGAVGGPVASTSTEIRTITPEEASSLITAATSTPVAGDAGSAALVTDTAATPAATAAPTSPYGNTSSAPATGAGPNQETGPSADGAVTVNGWSVVPRSS